MTEEDIKADRAFRVAQMQIGAANARDNNKSEEQIKRAIIEANKKGDLKAVDALQKILTGISSSMYGAGLRAETAEQTRRKDFITRNPTLIMGLNAANQSGDPKKIQAATIAIQQAARLAGVDLSAMAGGGASANRLTTGADGILTYNPQSPIE
jgi:hypothetical protein